MSAAEYADLVVSIIATLAVAWLAWELAQWLWSKR